MQGLGWRDGLAPIITMTTCMHPLFAIGPQGNLRDGNEAQQSAHAEAMKHSNQCRDIEAAVCAEAMKQQNLCKDIEAGGSGSAAQA
eukprot:1159569-Pelagomonas_calceolata.AAC.5